jgi:signal transduction histidine kinase
VKRKCIFILPWLLLPLISSFGQNLRLIDSLRSELHIAEGKEKFELLLDYAWEHRFASPDTTISYGNRAYQLGRQINLRKDVSKALNIIGVAFNYKGERLLAYEYYTKALQLSTAQNDSIQIAHSNNNIGRLFFDQGLLGRAYEHFIKARSIFQDVNDSSGLAYSYQSLGNLYKTQRDFKKAEDSFIKAYQIRIALGNTRDIMSALVYLGRFYQETNQWKKSIAILTKADSTGQKIGDNINLAEIKTYLAEGYLNMGKFAEAESIGRQGLEVIEKVNNIRMIPQAYHIMGQIHFRKNELAKAAEYFNNSLIVSTRIKDLNAQMRAYYDLWKLSERQHKEVDRLSFMNEYLILKDSIKDLDLARQVERLQFEIEIQRKDQENIMLKAEDDIKESTIKQQKLQNIILIVIIGFVSILGFVLWLTNKKREEKNEQLTKQNEEIQKQREEIIRQNQKLSKRNQQLSDLNHEKDTLMGIVAHDLKSPLHRIKGIVDLMELEGPLTEDQSIYLKMTRDATQAGLDLITDLLDVHMLEENVEPNYTSFDLSKFLLEKTNQFIPGAEAKNIHLYITRVSNDEVYTDFDYLNRIMDNLLSNAIKFSDAGSTVVVAAGRLLDEFWISVKDQGPGFTSGDQQNLYQKFKKLTARPTGGESSNGLGLAIVKTLIDRLHGKIELSTENGKGSEFTLRIPLVMANNTSSPPSSEANDVVESNEVEG